uniref:Uncharacterized protein n=1 Tax=Arundo donax TaxID=35708 RepID=A0A0A9EWD2_ARUDO
MICSGYRSKDKRPVAASKSTASKHKHRYKPGVFLCSSTACHCLSFLCAPQAHHDKQAHPRAQCAAHLLPRLHPHRHPQHHRGSEQPQRGRHSGARNNH